MSKHAKDQPQVDRGRLGQIIKSGDYDLLVKTSDEYGRRLMSMGLTTSQIRNIFGEVKIIQMRGFSAEKNRFKLLRPKVKYAAKRANSRGALFFAEIIDHAVSMVGDNEEYFENFVNFFESILAYHKVYGGK